MSLQTLIEQDASSTRPTSPVLDVVVPVYNEEIDLEPCVRRLHAYLTANLPYAFRITVADNASTDGTLEVARRLAATFGEVAVEHLEQKGRGRALKHVWTRSDATVLAYMDVDLSTDLGALLPLIAPLISGHSDLAIGSRLARGSRVVRGAKREFISRSYNFLLRGTLSARFSDAQCGFKAIRADVAERLLPMVEDTGWFFDTEMLVLAERAGLRIHEVPVDWVDDPDSRVDIVATAVEDLKGIYRLLRGFGSGRLPLAALRDQLGRQPLPVAGVPAGLVGQLVRFAAVGVASTLAYLALYALLRLGIGPQWANFLALLVTAIGNTAVNRRVTFGVRGSDGAWRHQVQGLLVFGIGLTLTSGSLALLDATTTNPAKHLELAVLIVANLVATAVRFLMLRIWVFRARRTTQPTPAPHSPAPQPAADAPDMAFTEAAQPNAPQFSAPHSSAPQFSAYPFPAQPTETTDTVTDAAQHAYVTQPTTYVTAGHPAYAPQHATSLDHPHTDSRYVSPAPTTAAMWPASHVPADPGDPFAADGSTAHDGTPGQAPDGSSPRDAGSTTYPQLPPGLDPSALGGAGGPGGFQR